MGSERRARSYILLRSITRLPLSPSTVNKAMKTQSNKTFSTSRSGSKPNRIHRGSSDQQSCLLYEPIVQGRDLKATRWSAACCCLLLRVQRVGALDNGCGGGLYCLFLYGLKKYISVPTRYVAFYRCSSDRETNPYRYVFHILTRWSTGTIHTVDTTGIHLRYRYFVLVPVCT